MPMEEKSNRELERKMLVKEFEEQLKNNSLEYFTLEAFEQITEYYLDNAKNDKALRVCDIAIKRYPFSVELKILKAQILSNQGYKITGRSLGYPAEWQWNCPP